MIDRFSRLLLHPQVAQIIRFIIVGTTAAAVHFSIVVYLVQLFHYAPLIANIAAFIVAFQVSYWGHRMWTFSETEVMHREAYPKLIILQVSVLCMNEGLYYLFLSLHIPYQLALLMVLAIMPFFTFVTSKFWVFQN